MLGLIITYVYAVVGWKFIVDHYKFGFDDSPVWDQDVHFTDWVLIQD